MSDWSLKAEAFAFLPPEPIHSGLLLRLSDGTKIRLECDAGGKWQITEQFWSNPAYDIDGQPDHQ